MEVHLELQKRVKRQNMNRTDRARARLPHPREGTSGLSAAPNAIAARRAGLGEAVFAPVRRIARHIAH